MRQSLPLMHFYSGKLLQFYSGVDTYVERLAMTRERRHDCLLEWSN
jgi:hypothetical protein